SAQHRLDVGLSDPNALLDPPRVPPAHQARHLHEDEPIELLGGQLVVSEPKSSLQSTAVRLVAEALPGQILQSVNSRCLSSSACAEAERRVTSTNFSSMRCSRRASTSARVAIT